MSPVFPKDLERGDHIKRRLGNFPVADHHGIYLGNSKVAHFSYPPNNSGDNTIKSEGSIRIDKFSRFAEGKPVYLVPHWDLKISKEEVAKTAEEYARKEMWKKQYNLFFKNCAHFVYYCYEEEAKVPVLTQQLCHYSKPKVGEVVVGEVGVKTDGAGMQGKAVTIRDEVEIGGVKMKTTFGTAEAGVKVWEKGLDLEVKTNARIAEFTAGALTVGFGPSLDTGIKFGSNCVGATFMGVGGQIGTKTNISLPGIKAEVEFDREINLGDLLLDAFRDYEEPSYFVGC